MKKRYAKISNKLLSIGVDITSKIATNIL